MSTNTIKAEVLRKSIEGLAHEEDFDIMVALCKMMLSTEFADIESGEIDMLKVTEVLDDLMHEVRVNLLETVEEEKK